MSINEYLNMIHDAICQYLDKTVHIQDLYKDEDGNYVDSFEPSKSTQEAITQYCMLHGVDRDKVNLLDIAEYVADGNINTDNIDYFQDEETETNLQKIIDTRVDTLGMYLDTDNKKIILLWVEPEYLNFIQQRCNHEGRGYQIRFKNNVTNQMVECNAWIASEEINIIQALYLKYFRDKA